MSGSQSTLAKFFKDILTENDGQSYDIVRIAIALVVLSGFPTMVWGVVYSTLHPEHHFDVQAFGIAMAALLAGICTAAVGLGQKQKTDVPMQPDSSSTASPPVASPVPPAGS